MSPDGKNIFLLGQWMPVDQARQVFSTLSQQAAESPGENVNIAGVMIPKAVIISATNKLENVLALKTKLDNKEITQEQYDTATGKQKTEDLQREGQAFLAQLQNPQATQQVAMASPPRSASPPEAAMVNLPQTINAPMPTTATTPAAPTTTTTGVTANTIPSNMTTVNGHAPMATPAVPANATVQYVLPISQIQNGQNVVIQMPQTSTTASGDKRQERIENMMSYFTDNIKPPDLYGGDGSKSTA
jgi:biotin carboxyl carrier protein